MMQRLRPSVVVALGVTAALIAYSFIRYPREGGVSLEAFLVSLLIGLAVGFGVRDTIETLAAEGRLDLGDEAGEEFP